MRHRVKLPRLGDTADEVVVLEWLIDEGSDVSEGDALLLVETDKVEAEVPSPVGGILRQQLVKPEDVVRTGETVAEIESA